MAGGVGLWCHGTGDSLPGRSSLIKENFCVVAGVVYWRVAGGVGLWCHGTGDSLPGRSSLIKENFCVVAGAV